ncbi:MAG: type II toxin-antitoxin system PemK/MazF family toxin [Nitrococcus sp.]|nr:type II toxin-antitoxin system PemK/MazF family toxin [Nitrococcus sp.]
MDGLKRGDVVLIVAQGDHGKPRPAVVVQADVFSEESTSMAVCPMTSTLMELRILRLRVKPSDESGLQKPSDIMVDKITTLKKSRIKDVIGRLDEPTMARLTRSLSVLLGIAEAA